MKKNKQMVFNERVDSSINGLALVLSFIIVGLFLQYDNQFFGNETRIIQVTFIVVGILGFFTEVKKINLKSNIKGVSDLFLGALLLITFYFLKIYLNSIINNEVIIALVNMIIFLFILLSLFGFCSGILKIIYSFYINHKSKEENKKAKSLSDFMSVIAQILGICLILVQIYETLSKVINL